MVLSGIRKEAVESLRARFLPHKTEREAAQFMLERVRVFRLACVFCRHVCRESILERVALIASPTPFPFRLPLQLSLSIPSIQFMVHTSVQSARMLNRTSAR